MSSTLSKLIDVQPVLKIVQVKVFRKGLQRQDRPTPKDLPCTVEVATGSAKSA